MQHPSLSIEWLLQAAARPSLADTLMAAAGRLSPFQDEADLRAAPEDLSSASDSGSQTPGLQNGPPCLHGPISCPQMHHPCTLLLPASYS